MRQRRKSLPNTERENITDLFNTLFVPRSKSKHFPFITVTRTRSSSTRRQAKVNLAVEHVVSVDGYASLVSLVVVFAFSFSLFSTEVRQCCQFLWLYCASSSGAVWKGYPEHVTNSTARFSDIPIAPCPRTGSDSWKKRPYANSRRLCIIERKTK